MRIFVTLLLFCLSGNILEAQSYTTYFTGNPVDRVTVPLGGVCLMGGATENDEAMRWFLQRANGGDVLVIRASGSDGYNRYMYQELGESVNSVETIVFHSKTASYDPFVHERINRAEAIWIAGGDQWNYVSYWRNTPVDSLINLGIRERNLAIGGTSAGMAVLGNFYFTAQNGTVTSSAALANPYATAVRVDTAAFFTIDILRNVITDTHYDNPDRRGRHVVFMARIAADYGLNEVKGIACEEYTSVCIEPNGIARVFGSYPNHEDFAYFIQVNCESPIPGPEISQPSTPLRWHRDGQALKVYRVAGTNSGNNFFNIGTWEGGGGGSWENWFVSNGTFQSSAGFPIACDPLSIPRHEISNHGIRVFPSPSRGGKTSLVSAVPVSQVRIFNLQGKQMAQFHLGNQTTTFLDTGFLPEGVYIVHVEHLQGTHSALLVLGH